MNGLLTPTPVRIAGISKEGVECRRFTFDPLAPVDGAGVKPGQFFMLSLPGFGEAAFTYLTRPNGGGSFSALIRRTGSLTDGLFECVEGTLLGYRGPFGEGGWPLDELRGKRVICVAGGIGLPPLATAIDSLLESECRVALIYGSRTPDSQVMESERAIWSKRMEVIETFDANAGPAQLTGTPLEHIDAVIPGLGGEPEAILTCGPEVMMHATAARFMTRGVPSDLVWLALERRMHCGVGLCGHCYIGSSYACVDGPVYRWDRLKGMATSGT